MNNIKFTCYFAFLFMLSACSIEAEINKEVTKENIAGIWDACGIYEKKEDQYEKSFRTPVHEHYDDPYLVFYFQIQKVDVKQGVDTYRVDYKIFDENKVHINPTIGRVFKIDRLEEDKFFMRFQGVLHRNRGYILCRRKKES